MSIVLYTLFGSTGIDDVLEGAILVLMMAYVTIVRAIQFTPLLNTHCSPHGPVGR